MKKAKRFIGVFLSALLVISLVTACGGGGNANTPSSAPSSAPPTASTSTAPTSQPSQQPSPSAMPSYVPPPETAEFVEDLVWVASDRIQTLDTTNPSTVSVGNLWQFWFFYDRLITYLPDGTFAPALATSWESDDLQTYRFKLRDDVYFHNGEKFTADDVAFSIDRAKTAPGTHIYDRMGSIVESYDVINDYEIVIKLSNVNVDFIPFVSWVACGIVNRKAIEEDPENGHLIGTGKFIVTDFVPNEYVQYQRNDNYWGDIPVTKTVTYRSIAEETARYTMLENNEAQIQWAVLPPFMDGLKSNPDLDYTSVVLNNFQYLGFNLLNPVLGDINFRKAVAHTIVRDDCIIIARDGWAAAPTPPITWGYGTEFRNNDVYLPEHDINKAKEYLAQSRYAGETFEIITSNPISTLNAQVIQEQLSEIGVGISVRELDGPTFMTSTQWGMSDYELILTATEWQDYASSARASFYPGVAGNRAQYDNPEVVALFDEALTTLDAAKRESLYKKIQESIAEDIPALLVFHTEMIIGIRNGVDGMRLYPNNCHDFSGVYMVKQ